MSAQGGSDKEYTQLFLLIVGIIISFICLIVWGIIELREAIG